MRRGISVSFGFIVTVWRCRWRALDYQEGFQLEFCPLRGPQAYKSWDCFVPRLDSLAVLRICHLRPRPHPPINRMTIPAPSSVSILFQLFLSTFLMCSDLEGANTESDQMNRSRWSRKSHLPRSRLFLHQFAGLLQWLRKGSVWAWYNVTSMDYQSSKFPRTGSPTRKRHVYWQCCLFSSWLCAKSLEASSEVQDIDFVRYSSTPCTLGASQAG